MHFLLIGVAVGAVLGHLLTAHWESIVRATTTLLDRPGGPDLPGDGPGAGA